MRVCPYCGFVDLIWRTNGHRPQVEYRWASEVENLSDNIKKGSVDLDEWFAYRLAGKGNVIIERVPKVLYDAYGTRAFSLNYEPFQHLTDPLQRVLFSEGFSSQEKSSATARGNTK